MPTIVVKTYANLRKYTDGAPSVELDVEPGTTIKGILERMRVPPGEARIIFINGRSVSLDSVVQDGEKGRTVLCHRRRIGHAPVDIVPDSPESSVPAPVLKCPRCFAHFASPSPPAVPTTQTPRIGGFGGSLVLATRQDRTRTQRSGTRTRLPTLRHTLADDSATNCVREMSFVKHGDNPFQAMFPSTMSCIIDPAAYQQTHPESRHIPVPNLWRYRGTDCGL